MHWCMQITIQYKYFSVVMFWNGCFWIIWTGSYMAILSYYGADVFLQWNKFDDNSKHSNQVIRIIGCCKRASQVITVQSLHSTKILFNYGPFLGFNIVFFSMKEKDIWKRSRKKQKERIKNKNMNKSRVSVNKRKFNGHPELNEKMLTLPLELTYYYR